MRFNITVLSFLLFVGGALALPVKLYDSSAPSGPSCGDLDDCADPGNVISPALIHEAPTFELYRRVVEPESKAKAKARKAEAKAKKTEAKANKAKARAKEAEDKAKADADAVADANAKAEISDQWDTAAGFHEKAREKSSLLHNYYKGLNKHLNKHGIELVTGIDPKNPDYEKAAIFYGERAEHHAKMEKIAIQNQKTPDRLLTDPEIKQHLKNAEASQRNALDDLKSYDAALEYAKPADKPSGIGKLKSIFSKKSQ